MGASKAIENSSRSLDSTQGHALRIRTRFVELIEKLLDKGSASVVLDVPRGSVTASDVSPIAFTAHTQHPGYEAFTASCWSRSRSQISGSERPARTEREKK